MKVLWRRDSAQDHLDCQTPLLADRSFPYSVGGDNDSLHFLLDDALGDDHEKWNNVKLPETQ